MYFLRGFKTPRFGLHSAYGRASHGGVNGLLCGASLILELFMFGLRLELPSSTLIPISQACLNLRALHFSVSPLMKLLAPLMGGSEAVLQEYQ